MICAVRCVASAEFDRIGYTMPVETSVLMLALVLCFAQLGTLRVQVTALRTENAGDTLHSTQEVRCS